MLHKILLEAQDCALREIEGSPVLWTCEIQGVKHRIFMRKVMCQQGPLGAAARAQLCITFK